MLLLQFVNVLSANSLTGLFNGQIDCSYWHYNGVNLCLLVFTVIKTNKQWHDGKGKRQWEVMWQCRSIDLPSFDTSPCARAHMIASSTRHQRHTDSHERTCLVFLHYIRFTCSSTLIYLLTCYFLGQSTRCQILFGSWVIYELYIFNNRAWWCVPDRYIGDELGRCAFHFNKREASCV